MVEVRRARADEIPACAALYARVLGETFTWDPPGRHVAADFLAHALDEEVYLARDGDRLLGIAGFHRPSAFLHSLYVETRGAGVGKALLDHVAAVAGGPLSLKCLSPNLRAQDFYLREGFRIVDVGRDPGAAHTWLRMTR